MTQKQKQKPLRRTRFDNQDEYDEMVAANAEMLLGENRLSEADSLRDAVLEQLRWYLSANQSSLHNGSWHDINRFGADIVEGTKYEGFYQRVRNKLGEPEGNANVRAKALVRFYLDLIRCTRYFIDNE